MKKAIKKAILVVSFGTSYHDTLAKTIVPIEQDLAAAFPERMLMRAFTSGMIMKKLKVRDGMDIPNVSQALETLLAQGYGDVRIQPTHVMGGDEYDKLCALAAPFATQFEAMTIGAPLLTTVADYKAVAQALMADVPAQTPEQAIVFMGHGTEHPANATYAMLEYVLHDMGRKDILIGTVEGYPALEEVQRRIAERGGVKQVHLRPLMIVAGDHAQNDLAGEEEDSWKSVLEAQGFATTVALKGLGEYPAIRALFVDHAKQVDTQA